MSGGHFNYAQYRLNDIASEIEHLIDCNDNPDEGNYPDEVVTRFREAIHTIRQAEEMAQRVDWLVSGDDGDDSFLRRWKKEVRAYWKRAKQ